MEKKQSKYLPEHIVMVVVIYSGNARNVPKLKSNTSQKLNNQIFHNNAKYRDGYII